MATPTDPKLWEKAKKKHRSTAAGSPRGRWSARKAARARLEYRLKGGNWKK